MRILEAPAYSNALHSEELLLRGARVASCGAVAELRDCYDVVDLTHNELAQLTGEFPRLQRLSGLLLAHNKISAVEDEFGERLPHLHMLSLAHNELDDVEQLRFLRHLSRLEHLSLEGNPITQALPDYRDHVVALQPHIRFLDFEHVRESDRQRAMQKYSSQVAPPRQESAETRARREQLLARLDSATDLAEIDEIDKELAALESA